MRKSLKQIFKELPAKDFVWADRGRIVGSMQIDRIEGNEIFVTFFWRCDLLNAIAIVSGYFFVLSTFGGVEILLTGFRGGKELIRATVKKHGVPRVLYLLIFETNWF